MMAKQWTQSDIHDLIEYYPIISAMDLAKKLKRTPSAVRAMAHKWKLNKYKLKTKDQPLKTKTTKPNLIYPYKKVTQ